MEEVKYSNGDINNLCDTCPMRDIEDVRDFAIASRRLDDHLDDDDRFGPERIGNARDEIGVVVNACRRLRRDGDCTPPEKSEETQDLDGIIFGLKYS